MSIKKVISKIFGRNKSSCSIESKTDKIVEEEETKKYKDKENNQLYISISDEMVNKYRLLCNKGKDTPESARYRIIKGCYLSPYVSENEDNKTYHYFDMRYVVKKELGREVLVDIYRDRSKYYRIDAKLKEEYDKKYGEGVVR